jgi:hypothetical protein
MFTVFHFGFEIFKIAVLTAIYSLFIYSAWFVFKEIRGNHKFARFRYRLIYLSIYVLMGIYSFTYFGNHGLGDESYLPLGHYQTMYAADGYAFFTFKDTSRTISVDSFVVKNDSVCMESANTYYVYDLRSEILKKFENRNLYEQYALSHSLPLINRFKKFYELYNEYWNGWRFWALP